MANVTRVSLTTRREAVRQAVKAAAATAGVVVDEAEAAGLIAWAVADQEADDGRRADIVACLEGEETAAREAATRSGARHVVVLPAGVDWLARMFGAADHPSGPAKVISVLGSPGGAGASTVALAVAVAAAARSDTLLVDADAAGQGLHAVLSPPGDLTGWQQIDSSAQRLDLAAARTALPVVAPGLWLLAGGVSESELAALPAVIDVGRRGFGHTVVDQGRTWRGGSGEVVLVVRGTVAGVMGGQRLAAGLFAAGVTGRLVVRTTGMISSAEIAATVGLPVALEVPDWRRLPELWDSGEALAGRGRRRLLDWGNAILDAA